MSEVPGSDGTPRSKPTYRAPSGPIATEVGTACASTVMGVGFPKTPAGTCSATAGKRASIDTRPVAETYSRSLAPRRRRPSRTGKRSRRTDRSRTPSRPGRSRDCPPTAGERPRKRQDRQPWSFRARSAGACRRRTRTAWAAGCCRRPCSPGNHRSSRLPARARRRSRKGRSPLGRLPRSPREARSGPG